MAAFIRNRLRMGLLLKMWLLGLVMAVSITLVFCYYILPGYQARVFNERRAEVQSSVVTALGVLESIHSLEEQGMLSTAEAQSWALADTEWPASRSGWRGHLLGQRLPAGAAGGPHGAGAGRH